MFADVFLSRFERADFRGGHSRPHQAAVTAVKLLHLAPPYWKTQMRCQSHGSGGEIVSWMGYGGGGAIKDAFGGLLQAVQIPTGDVAGVA